MTLKELLHKTLLYDSSTGVFTRRIRSAQKTKIGERAGGLNSDRYRQIRLAGRQYKAHRLAWLYVYGEWPSLQIDHKNGNRDDNRIANLRLATHAQNVMNAGKRCTKVLSKYKGVRRRPTGNWEARITIDRKPIYLGSFNSEERAYAAYCEAALKLHGEFAKL